MGLKKIFLGWNEALAEVASNRLIKKAKLSEFADLSHILAVVSTTHSLSVLKSRLAELSEKQGYALLPPKIVTPQYFFSNQTGAKIPSETQKLLFWIEAVKRNALRCRFLFPDYSGKNESFIWYADRALQICKLADTLASAGLTIEQLIEVYPKVLNEDFARFDELSHIEASYFKILEENGFEDENAVKIQNARTPQVPDNISKVIFIAVPDPIPIVLESIETLSAMTDVEIWINAPSELECAFDNYGRPEQSAWKNIKIAIPNFKENVSLFESQENLARDFVNLIANKNASGSNQVKLDDMLIVMPDASLEIPLRYSFNKYGIDVYNPSGRKLTEFRPYILFRALSEFITLKDYASFSILLRNHDFLSYVQKEIENLDFAKIFILNDEVQNKYMPLTFEDLLSFASALKTEDELTKKAYLSILSKLKHFIEITKGDSLKASELMLEIYKAISPSLENENLEAIKIIVESISEIAILMKNSELSQNDVSLVLNKKLQQITIFPVQKEDALPLRGFLELQWEEINRPLTFIVGMNEGILPSVTVSDIFLPDSARKKIGLPCNDSRFARDAFILNAAINSKKNSAFNFVVMKTSKEGEPLKPSRLLLQTNNQSEFFERLNHLYKGSSIEFESCDEEKTDFPLKFYVPFKSAKNFNLYVTDFKNFLACPFRFYLGKVLEYKDEMDDRQTDIDEATFGSICHFILKELGKNINSKNQKELEKILDEVLESQKKKFTNSIPVEFSFYSVEQRMKKALELMLEDRSQGNWKFFSAEEPFTINLDSNKLSEWLGETIKEEFSFSILGRIDRIDISRDGKYLRIIDYKTGKVSDSPAKEHYSAISAKTDISGIKTYSIFDFCGKAFRWNDLQLPLYAIIMNETEKFKSQKITDCSYFTIPKAVSDTDIKTWTLTDEEIAAAKRCAAGIILDIAQGNFWPPAEKVKYDNYEKLLYSPDYEKYIRIESRNL